MQSLGSYAAYLRYVYELLLKESDISLQRLDQCAAAASTSFAAGADEVCVRDTAYNWILTEDYMFLVPRRQLAHLDSVNGMGFFGLLWATSEPNVQSIR